MIVRKGVFFVIVRTQTEVSTSNWADPYCKILLYVCAVCVILHCRNVFNVVTFLHVHINVLYRICSFQVYKGQGLIFVGETKVKMGKPVHLFQS